jgi:hypothetical protein
MHLKRENQQANECFNLLISFPLLCSFFLNESSARKDTKNFRLSPSGARFFWITAAGYGQIAAIAE